MIVICTCAYYLCQSCTTDQVAEPIELTTTFEEPGLTPQSSQWLFFWPVTIPSFFFFLSFLFFFIPYNTLTLRHIHLAVDNHPEIEKEKKDVCNCTRRGSNEHVRTHTHTPWAVYITQYVSMCSFRQRQNKINRMLVIQDCDIQQSMSRARLIWLMAKPSTYIQYYTYSTIHTVLYIQYYTYSTIHTVLYIQYYTYSTTDKPVEITPHKTWTNLRSSLHHALLLFLNNGLQLRTLHIFSV